MTGHYDDLKAKTFLVTGASSGIGKAVAEALGAQGATVWITGRNQARLQATADQIGDKAHAIIADLTIEIERCALVDALPALDGVCHSAGIIDPFPIRYLDEARFDKILNINTKAPILLTARLLKTKKLNQEASLVFLSSISSQRAMRGGALYSASKAALEAFSRTIPSEHAARHIRSNCLLAGLTQTPILMQAISLAQASSDDCANSLSSRELINTSESVTDAMLFLLSSASRRVNASLLTVDGGNSVFI